MIYSNLGDTDIEVSKICLGTMTFGEQNSEKEGHQQMDYALEQGVNFFDTAELYSVPPKASTQGSTERIIGTWLKKTGKRDQIILASKVAGPNPNMTWFRGGPDFSRTQIREAVEGSLQRLQTDYLDLYQLHWPDRNTNFFGQLGYTHEEDENTQFAVILDSLQELIYEGKIRHIGISNETPYGFMKYLMEAEKKDLPRVRSIQNPYNLLNRTFEIGNAEIALREKAGLLAYSPMGFGVLSGKYLGGKQPDNARLTLFPHYDRYSNENATNAVKAYAKIADDFGVSLAQMSLAFVTTRPFMTANIIGATTMEQLKENIDSVNVEITEEMMQQINEVHKMYPNPAP
ncbi:NADP(H)-dependent aldo-keto reductase [Persicobacter psychrovividus]|uniref:Aldo/keto reductase n=1 Tax=Persicobacter psychrovividus TaxID=387638 RepID=A0ABM7VDF7_9BACT|nr:aldo/keto reductase [Persicobacter psychrovividus]